VFLARDEVAASGRYPSGAIGRAVDTVHASSQCFLLEKKQPDTKRVQSMMTVCVQSMKIVSRTSLFVTGHGEKEGPIM
jgi:hypothetical protein